MSQLFRQNLLACAGAMVEEVCRHGASYYADALNPQICEALCEEIAGQGVFQTLHNIEDVPVIEDMQIQKIPMAHPRFSLLTRVGMELARLLNPYIKRRGDIEWLPNQAAAHRYYSGSQGLGAHRDFSSDELLIAVFTLRGQGDFELLRADGSLDTRWSCGQGGLCLMRAPGLTGQDDRPLHRAAAPREGYRESLIYRQINWEKAVQRGHSL
jgi:hypothetical protein